MGVFDLVKKQNRWAIQKNGQDVASLFSKSGFLNAVMENEKFVPVVYSFSIGVESEDCKIADDENWKVHDTVTELDDGFYKVERIFANISSAKRKAVLVFDIQTKFKPDFYMIPCVNYNGNKWGSGNEPKGLTRDGKPWVFAYNRQSLPSASFSEDASTSLCLFTSDVDEQSLVSSSSLVETENGLAHRIIWPDREMPLLYYDRDCYAEGIDTQLEVETNRTYSVTFYVSLAEVGRKNFGWIKTYDRAQDVFKYDIKDYMEGDTFWKYRMEFIKNWQFNKRGDNDKYSLFEMGLLPAGKYYNYFDPNVDEGNPHISIVESQKPEYVTETKRSNIEDASDEPIEFKIRDEYRYEIGWCGQNASQAVALIADYIKNNDEDSLAKATAVLDTWTKYAALPSGLFKVVFDDVISRENGNNSMVENEYDIDTCNLGWGMWQLLEAYQMLKTINIDKPEYLKFAIDACDFFVVNRAKDGSFGKMWFENGTLKEEGGTIGCYILLGLLKAYEVTMDEKYLNISKEMYKFYVERDLNICECSAGALDTECIDKETCWPLCKIGIDLYEITGDKKYLDDAIHAAYYMLTFTFHYNAIYGPETDFSKLGYMAYGATAVSTQHQHLDPWGSLISYDMYRLFEITGDEKWKTRFEAMWRNAILCSGDGKFKVHGLVRPKSAQNEAFLQSRFTFGPESKPGRLNDWIQSWPGAFKLITMMRAKDDDLFK